MSDILKWHICWLLLSTNRWNLVMQSSSLSDLRLVVLTSVTFKPYVQIVLPQLDSFVQDSLDPFQFAYQNNRSYKGALLVTIDEVTSHLVPRLSVEKKQS